MTFSSNLAEPRLLAARALTAYPPSAIVIGGSAGGIEALKLLLPAFSPRLPLPIFVVLHVGAEARNVWAMLFERSALPVREAEDKDVAEPGHLYIAPPNYHLLVGNGGQLQLSLDARVHFARPSIDVLFESAAWVYRDRLLGIVLSGANSDGASGLAAIARNGGQAWVQNPDTASAVLMPRSAIEAVPTALVLDLADMARVFGEWDSVEEDDG